LRSKTTFLTVPVKERAAALISDEVLGRFAFAGTPAEVAGHAEAVFEAGASRVDFGTPTGSTSDGVSSCSAVPFLPRLTVI
jgi:5,10-methylenetetrahydromethanopterin reductase